MIHERPGAASAHGSAWRSLDMGLSCSWKGEPPPTNPNPPPTRQFVPQPEPDLWGRSLRFRNGYSSVIFFSSKHKDESCSQIGCLSSNIFMYSRLPFLEAFLSSSWEEDKETFLFNLHLIQSFEYKLTYIWITDSHLLSVGAPPHPPGGACTLAKSHPSHSLLLCSCAADVGLSTSIHLLGTWTNYELEGELNSLVPFSYSLGKFGIVTGSNHTTGASNTWETRSLQNFMLPMIDSNTT